MQSYDVINRNIDLNFLFVFNDVYIQDLRTYVYEKNMCVQMWQLRQGMSLWLSRLEHQSSRLKRGWASEILRNCFYCVVSCSCVVVLWCCDDATMRRCVLLLLMLSHEWACGFFWLFLIVCDDVREDPQEDPQVSTVPYIPWRYARPPRRPFSVNH